MEKETYAQHWSILNRAVSLLLSTPERCRREVSFQDTYYCIYRLVHMGHAQKLYDDLLKTVCGFLSEQARLLEQKNDNPAEYVVQFESTLKIYFEALKGIVPMFLYLNRVYLQSKLKLDLMTVLMNTFMELFVVPNVSRVINLIDEMQGHHLLLDPRISSSVVSQLYSLDNGYASLNQALFSKFIPRTIGNRQRLTDDVVVNCIEETRKMEEEIIRTFDHNRGDQSRKRSHPGDTEES